MHIRKNNTQFVNELKIRNANINPHTILAKTKKKNTDKFKHPCCTRIHMDIYEEKNKNYKL